MHIRPLLGLVLLALVGCPSRSGTTAATSSATPPTASTAETTPPASATATASAATSAADAGSSGPAWLTAALRAPTPQANAAKTERSKVSPFRDDAAIDALLDKVAAAPATAAGLRAAAKLLEDGKGTGQTKMVWAGSGTAPAGSMLHAGGVALLADLVTRACSAAPHDAAIGKAVNEIPIPAMYSSVLDKSQMNRDRDALRGAGSGCGMVQESPF